MQKDQLFQEFFQKYLDLYESGEEMRNICIELYEHFLEILKSDEYQNILKEENSRWKNVFSTKDDVTPAAGLNYKAFGKCVKKTIGERFDLASKISDDYILEPPLDVEFGHYHTNTTFGDMPTYIPNDSETICKDYISGSERPLDFINRINEKCSIFEYDSKCQARFMFFDIIYSCMEKFFDQLPKENRIDTDYENSLYMNPDFLQNELSLFFPFYIPIYDAEEKEYTSDELKMRILNPVKSIRTPKELVSEAAYPLSVNSWEEALGLFDEEIRQYRKSNFPSKILKACLPLFFFTYNNILFETIQNPQKVISRIKRCRFIGTSWDFSSIEESLKLGIEAYKYKHHKDNSGKDEEKNTIIAAQLYALRRFHIYTEWLYDRRFGEITMQKKDRSVDYMCKVAKKTGNKKEHFISDVRFDSNSSLTAWLFIKYSELFRIALMPKVESIFMTNDDFHRLAKESIIFPTNFLTAFNFSSAAFINYPSFFKRYSKFIQAASLKLIKKFPKFGFVEWLGISNCLDSTFPMGYYEMDRVNDILYYFFEFINFQIPDSPDQPYIFNEEKFREYFNMTKEIEKNLQVQS